MPITDRETEGTKHTPGAWRIHDKRAIEAKFEGEWVQIAAMNRTRWSEPHQDKNNRLGAHLEADARLIAAAPMQHELLLALDSGIWPTLEDWAKKYGGDLKEEGRFDRARRIAIEDAIK